MKVKMSFPLFGTMFLILFTLKLAEIGAVATWSWWLVTAPLWAPLAFFFGCIGLVAAVGAVVFGVRSVFKMIGG